MDANKATKKTIYCTTCGNQMATREEAAGIEARCEHCRTGFVHISTLLMKSKDVPAKASWDKPIIVDEQTRRVAEVVRSVSSTW